MAPTCIGKTAKEKKFSVTYYRAEYERNNKRVNSKHGRYLKSKRQSTVEPVFGTLTQFMGLRKINIIGIVQANKVMHRTAAYNLKKCLKFIQKRSKSKAKAQDLCQQLQKGLQKLKTSLLNNPKKLIFHPC